MNYLLTWISKQNSLGKAEDNTLAGQHWGCAGGATWTSILIASSSTPSAHPLLSSRLVPNSVPVSLIMKSDFKMQPLKNHDIKMVQVNCLHLWWTFNPACLVSAHSPHSVANLYSKVLLCISHHKRVAGHTHVCSILEGCLLGSGVIRNRMIMGKDNF